MCQRRRVQVLFLMMVVLGFVVACDAVGETTPTQLAVAPTQTDTPTATPTLLPTATATATLIPSPTVTLMPTATATPAPTCPEPSTAVSFPQPADTTELQASILAYLNAGGQWEDLFALLDELEIEHDWIEADMNGDGVLETAVYSQLYDEENYLPDHAWWIFQCAANHYKVIHDVRGTYAFHNYFIADDLNNDNRQEVIAISGFAGSACDLEPDVWSWQGDEIVDYSPSYLELELGCGADDERVLLEDINGDGIKEMVLIGITVAHLDLAPPRGITQTFALEDTGYKLTNTVFAPPDLRIYVLDDAQKAMDAGDLNAALSHYSKAANEEMRTAGSSYLLTRDEYFYGHAYQQAFALFRLAIIQRVTENVVEADAVLTELNNRYQENQPGYEFVVLAQTFFDSYEEQANLIEACEQVTEYIEEHYANHDLEQPTLTMHFYWGANIAAYYTPESFCPVFSTD